MKRTLHRISIGIFSLYLCAVTVFARELIPVVVPGYAAPTPEGYIYKNWKGYVC